MSRCFPFPPPGYEKKVKFDDPSLLKKEKRKEKIPKKENKESKEKREKERTDEKRREKKDKKEKHRNSDKDKLKGDSLFPDEKRTAAPTPDVHLQKFHEKSKNRENDGNVTSGEKRVAGQPVFNNGESVGKSYHLASQPVSKNNHLGSQTKIYENSPGMVGRRNTDDERRIGNQLPYEKVSAERQKDGAVKISGTSAVPNMDAKAKTNEKPVVEKMDVSGFIGKPKFSGNALGQTVVGSVKLPGRSPGPLVDGRERKDKQAKDGRMGGLAVSGEARSGSSSLPPNFNGISQNRVGAMVRPLEKEHKQKLEGAKIIREDGEYKKGEKKKEFGEKPFHQDNEKKKEEKVKVTSEIKKPVQVPSAKTYGSENHILIPCSKTEIKKDLSATKIGLQSIPKPSGQVVTTLLGKRKDIAVNGIYDEHVTGPNKLAKTTVSTPPLTKNGRSLDPCQNPAAYAARPPMNIKAERTFAPDETQRSPMNIKMDSKEQHKINDINSESPITQSSHTTSKAERKSKIHAKPPHPDTKYLSQVLTVPKLEEWPEIDDQEWLCSSNISQAKKSRVETFGVDEEPMVWANALWLKPADIFALPFVIPH